MITPEILTDIRATRTAFLRYIEGRKRDPKQDGHAIALLIRIGLKHGVPAMVGLLMILPDSAMGLMGVIKSFGNWPLLELQQFVKSCAPHLDEFTLDQLSDLGRRVANPDEAALRSFGLELLDCLD